MNNSAHEDFDRKEYSRFNVGINLYKDLDRLKGIIKGIECDREINQLEKQNLSNWLSQSAIRNHVGMFVILSEMLEEALADSILTLAEKEEILEQCESYSKENKYHNLISSRIQEMAGVLQGVSADTKINTKELDFLSLWLEENEFLKGIFPYDEVYTVITQVLQDGVITEEEHSDILLLNEALADIGGGSENHELISLLKSNVYHIDPDIIFPERSFVITGLSKKYKRKEIAEKLELYGAIVQPGINKQVHYLVVCANKNESWAFGSYGRKIEKAMEYRSQGQNIIIVHENDLYDALASFKTN